MLFIAWRIVNSSLWLKQGISEGDVDGNGYSIQRTWMPDQDIWCDGFSWKWHNPSGFGKTNLALTCRMYLVETGGRNTSEKTKREWQRLDWDDGTGNGQEVKYWQGRQNLGLSGWGETINTDCKVASLGRVCAPPSRLGITQFWSHRSHSHHSNGTHLQPLDSTETLNLGPGRMAVPEMETGADKKRNQHWGKCVWTGAIINKGKKDNELTFDKLEHVSTLMTTRRKIESMLKARRDCLMWRMLHVWLRLPSPSPLLPLPPAHLWVQYSIMSTADKSG